MIGAVLGEEVRYEQIALGEVRDRHARGMYRWFQSYAHYEPDVEKLRRLHPGLLTFRQWLEAGTPRPAQGRAGVVGRGLSAAARADQRAACRRPAIGDGRTPKARGAATMGRGILHRRPREVPDAGRRVGHARAAALRAVRRVLVQLPHGHRRAPSRVARRAGRRQRVPDVRRVRPALPARVAALRADRRRARRRRPRAAHAGGADVARRHVLIGGGAATIAAAEAIREADGDAEIVVVCADPHGYYSRPGLAYFLTHELPADRLSPFTPEDVRRLDLTWITEAATAVDPAAHRVTLESGRRAGLRPPAARHRVEGHRHARAGRRAGRRGHAGRHGRRARHRPALPQGQGRGRGRRRHHGPRDRGGPPGAAACTCTTSCARTATGATCSPSPSRASSSWRCDARACEIHTFTDLAAIRRPGRQGGGGGDRERRRDPLRHRRRRRRRAPPRRARAGGRPAVRARRPGGRVPAHRRPRHLRRRRHRRDRGPAPATARCEVLWNPALLKGRVAGLNMATRAGAHATSRTSRINVTRLAGLHTTIIGAVGSGKDADLEGLSRGDSEIWSELGDAGASSRRRRGDAHVRLDARRAHRGRRRRDGRPDALVPAAGAHRGPRRPTGGDRQRLAAPGAPIAEIVNGLWARRGRPAAPDGAGGAAGSGTMSTTGTETPPWTAVSRRPRGARAAAASSAYALAAIVAVTALYGGRLLAGERASPPRRAWVGHGIGIAGFVLMLMTATLYSLRKLRADARWGSTASWLKFHMVTGLVGPYMVLLHTAMQFNGLAGLTMLLTVVVVASGLVGRYLYTRVPRTPSGRAAPAGAPAAERRKRWPPGTRSTCRSPGRSSSPPSSTSSRRSTTRRCSGRRGGRDEAATRIPLRHRDRGGHRRLPRRWRRDAPLALASSAPALLNAQTSADSRRARQAKATPLGGVSQPRPARQRLRRLPPGAVELPDHGRHVPRLPHRRRRRDQGKTRAARTARSDAARRPCGGCHPEHNGPMARSPRSTRASLARSTT